ncbi:unnamed protein product [Symbiodinium sp. CCMP2456]|nr:unnamed protein product [Symbiodinium sp. CCMP2456]
MRAESMLEFLRDPVHMDAMCAWLEVNDVIPVVIDALILARSLPTSLESQSSVPPSRRETVVQFLDQYFGHGWSNWQVPFSYTPDYMKPEYQTGEFSVVRSEIDTFSYLP